MFRSFRIFMQQNDEPKVMKGLKSFKEFINENWSSFIDRREMQDQKARSLKATMDNEDLPFSDADAKAIAKALGKPISKLKIVAGTSEDDGYSKEYRAASKVHYEGQKDGPIDLPHKNLKDVQITINKKAGTVEFYKSDFDGVSVSGFVYESVNESMDLMSSLEDMVKKSGNTILDSQLNFQKFDKEIFFDFEANGIQYRVHKDKEDFVSITNMDNNEAGRLETTDDLIPYIN